MLPVSLRDVAGNASIARQNLVDRAADVDLLILGKLFGPKPLSNLRMFAARTVAGFARCSNQVRCLGALIAGFLAVDSGVTLQTTCIGFVFGRQNVEGLGMLRLSPLKILIEVTRRALLGADVRLIRRRLVERRLRSLWCAIFAI